MMRAAALVGFAVLVASAAVAEIVRDEATGLVIEPPPGLTASRLPPRGNNTALFAVRTPADRDTGCQVAFAPAPQNRRYSQAELNNVAGGELWQGMARQAVSGLFEIEHAETFEHAGIRGLLMEGRPRLLDAMPENVRQRAQELRFFFVILETPAGRTSTVCVGEAATFDARRPEFVSVARSSQPPG